MSTIFGTLSSGQLGHNAYHTSTHTARSALHNPQLQHKKQLFLEASRLHLCGSHPRQLTAAFDKYREAARLPPNSIATQLALGQLSRANPSLVQPTQAHPLTNAIYLITHDTDHDAAQDESTRLQLDDAKNDEFLQSLLDICEPSPGADELLTLKGICSLRGIGIERDRVKALQLWHKAATKDLTGGITEAGILYCIHRHHALCLLRPYPINADYPGLVGSARIQRSHIPMPSGSNRNERVPTHAHTRTHRLTLPGVVTDPRMRLDSASPSLAYTGPDPVAGSGRLLPDQTPDPDVAVHLDFERIPLPPMDGFAHGGGSGDAQVEKMDQLMESLLQYLYVAAQPPYEHPAAQNYVGLFLLISSQFANPQRLAESRRLLEAADIKKLPDARTNLRLLDARERMLNHIMGVSADNAKWDAGEADKGLSKLFQADELIRSDPERAFWIYESVAFYHQSADACLRLAQCCIRGKGTQRNLAFAGRYYLKAALIGNPAACFALGCLCAGLVTPLIATECDDDGDSRDGGSLGNACTSGEMNLNAAQHWWRRAADLGHRDAARLLRLMD